MSCYTSRTLNIPFDRAVLRIEEELEQEGFGILTWIDVQETLRRKLGVDVEPCWILGAHNSALTDRALKTEDKVGLMLRALPSSGARKAQPTLRSSIRWS